MALPARRTARAVCCVQAPGSASLCSRALQVGLGAAASAHDPSPRSAPSPGSGSHLGLDPLTQLCPGIYPSRRTPGAASLTNAAATEKAALWRHAQSPRTHLPRHQYSSCLSAMETVAGKGDRRGGRRRRGGRKGRPHGWVHRRAHAEQAQTPEARENHTLLEHSMMCDQRKVPARGQRSVTKRSCKEPVINKLSLTSAVARNDSIPEA